MRLAIGIAIGFALGVAAYWIYANRQTIGLVVENRNRLTSGARLLTDVQDFWGTL